MCADELCVCLWCVCVSLFEMIQDGCCDEGVLQYCSIIPYQLLVTLIEQSRHKCSNVAEASDETPVEIGET